MAAWSAIANRTVEIPEDLIPAPPECKVRTLERYIDSLKSVLKELDTAKDLVNKYITVLKAVQGAGNKAAADLMKLSQGKNLSEETVHKYAMGARAASSIAGSAADELRKYE